MDIHKSTVGEDHADYQTSLNGLVVLYRTMGKQIRAEQLLNQVLRKRKKVLGKNHLHIASTLINLSAVCLSRGKLRKAESYLKECLRICKSTVGENHADYLAAVNHLAEVYMVARRFDESIKQLEFANKIQDKLVGRVFGISSDRQRMIYLSRVRASFYTYMSLVLHHFPNSQRFARNAYNQVLRRKGISAEAWSATRNPVIEGRYPHLKNKLEELKCISMHIAQKTHAGPEAMENISEYKRGLVELTVRKENLESELASSTPEFGLRKHLGDIRWRDIAKKLRKGEVLLEYVKINVFNFESIQTQGDLHWKPPKYLVFVISGDNLNCVHMLDLGEAEYIESLVSSFRSSITGEGDIRNYGSMRKVRHSYTDFYGKDLREVIFDPIRKHLGRCNRIFISPDGSLNKLPFEVLPAYNSNRRLIDDYHISYLTTGRDLLRFRLSSKYSGCTEPIVIADPDFDLSKNKKPEDIKSSIFCETIPYFPRLKGTRVEGECIAALLGVRPWMNTEALELSLKHLHSPKILHIATHGFFLPNLNDKSYAGQINSEESYTGRLSGYGLDNPLLRSGLALAGVNSWIRHYLTADDAEDGIVTAEDISHVDLLGTQLVVLSACDTGLGEVHSGEGVFGLRRAFVLSGARTLIMSLWKVPDKQTQELMVEFYRQILRGKARADALRDAQLMVKRSFHHPKYWGAFICQGDPGPINEQ